MRERAGNLLLPKNCFYGRILSPLGSIYLIFLGESLIKVTFVKPSCRKSTAPHDIKSQFDGYFNGSRRGFSLPINFYIGTPFEHDVWHLLNKVRYGETKSYKWLAQEVGKPRAVRAVGQALKKNPLPIVLPCHRIIESNDSIGGYSHGSETKRRLLELEYYFSKHE